MIFSANPDACAALGVRKGEICAVLPATQRNPERVFKSHLDSCLICLIPANMQAQARKRESMILDRCLFDV